MNYFFRGLRPILQKLLDAYYRNSKSSGEVGDADFHVDLIVHLASILRPNCYVELGVYKGETFNRVSRFANKSYAVDINPESKSYIRKESDFFSGSTEDFLRYFSSEGRKIDLLFIDADHSASSVEFEFKEFFPYVSDQGVILLHDGYPLREGHTVPEICGDGYKAIERLSQKVDGYEMVTVPFPPGLTICRKRNQQVPWQKDLV